MTELTHDGNHIVRSFDTRNGFIHDVIGLVCLFDNGYTAAYYNDIVLITYCEGDICTITGDNLAQERAVHLQHYLDNEV